MRRILAVFLLAVVAQARAATVKGTIIVNEVGGAPMANVQIIDSAHTGGPWASGTDGGFTLDYPQRYAGQRVRIVVNKEGYVVVNDVQLDLALPDDPNTNPLQIIICKEADREEMARRFYRLKSFDAIEETYQKHLKELEDMQQATAAALTKLQQERDQAKSAAEKASEELAKSQPGQSSELYQEAKRLFLAGKIDEAIKLLDDNKLRSSVAEAQRRREEAEKAIQAAVQAWLLKAQLFIVQFRFDEADKAYLQAIDAAPDSFEANFTYVFFNGNLKRYEKAVTACSRCLELARKGEKTYDLALALNEMGLLDIAQNRMDDARQAIEEALRIGHQQAEKNPESYPYQSFVALTLNNLGMLDTRQNRLEEARQEYEEALKISRELAQKSPETYQVFVLASLNGVGMLDITQHRLEEAQKSYEEALEIERKPAEKNPGAYLPELALELNNLGVVQSDQHRLEEAQSSYEEALGTYRKLVEKNPEADLPNLARVLNNLGVVQLEQHRLEEAQSSYEEALGTYRKLVEKNPEADLPNLARVLNNLGVVQLEQHRLEEAQSSYEEALGTYRKLAEKNPEAYLPNLALALNNLGAVQMQQHRLEEAQSSYEQVLEAYRQALAISKRLAEQEPSNADRQHALAEHYVMVGAALGAQGKLAESLEAYRQDLTIIKRLAEQDPSNANRQRELMAAKLLGRAKVVITEIIPGSPAEKLGLREGDVMLSYDGRKILDFHVLPYMTASTGGPARELCVRRAGQELTFSAPSGRLGISATNVEPAEP